MSERRQKLNQAESSVAARQKAASSEAHRADLPRRAASSGLASLPNRLWQAGNRAINQLLGRRNGGQPLAPQTRAEMEQSFNADFSGVRIHDDPTASAAAGEVGAEAFTHGDDIYLAESASVSGTAEGKSLLAHELAHVVQQRRAGGTQSDAVDKPGDSFEADADRAAAHAGAGRPVQMTATGAPPSVQRQPAEKGLMDKALDFILEKGISYTDEGWKIGGVPIEKLPDAAKTSAKVISKILKGDLAGAVEVVNPKDLEEERRAWEKVRKIKEEIDSLRPIEEQEREKEESKRREEELIPEAAREAAKDLGIKPRDPKSELKVPEFKLSSDFRMGPISHTLLDDFDLEKSQLKSKHRRKLNDLADQVMSDPSAELDIIGHTDSTGTEEFNQKLSEDRANAVRDYLVKRGVNPNKIRPVTGKAASEPWSTGNTDADRAANRRVEIFYTPGVVEKKKRGFGLPGLRLNR